jgi:hypothetical protein
MEATTTAAEVVHEVDTVTDGVEFQPVCACGWASDWLEDDVAAVVAGVDHPEIAVGPPDRLDQLMGQLLDLQDDVSEVVVWLAENWSADLPAPAIGGSCRGLSRPLDLTIECRSGDELARVAAVLGSELSGDPVYDVEGEIYRCARRRFGRVMLAAWRYEP